MDYLRQLGALDESEEGNPRIIVPNYLASPTNCLGASSGIYNVCCLDECTNLLAQWMHHAYPRECVFPHVSGTTKPRAADVYMAETGLESSASKEEMLQHAKKASPRQKRLTAQKKTTPRFQ